jgi:hypothetical protein
MGRQTQRFVVTADVDEEAWEAEYGSATGDELRDQIRQDSRDWVEDLVEKIASAPKWSHGLSKWTVERMDLGELPWLPPNGARVLRHVFAALVDAHVANTGQASQRQFATAVVHRLMQTYEGP